MRFAHISVELPEPLMAFAQEQAERNGTSLEAWLSHALVDRIAREQETESFFEERRKRAVPGAFHELLKRVPGVPPMPGDELE
jgi:hypothetical protein